ncbi:MAG: hypothetical protein KDC71_08930 [Acidobacteria bacterium]|nr:hypothetical protein [Acidobacteriota bacterium]
MALEQQFNDFLNRVVAEDALHARFLNTISLLEYIGARKMAKSLPQRGFDGQMLAHLSEEARHALVFKRWAERLNGQPMDFSAHQLLASKPAQRYIQAIDRQAQICACQLGLNPAETYWLATWMIEVRAMWAYPRYQAVLKQNGHGPGRISLAAIIREEQSHLRDMGRFFDQHLVVNRNVLQTLETQEDLLFSHLLNQWAQSLDHTHASSKHRTD